MKLLFRNLRIKTPTLTQQNIMKETGLLVLNMVKESTAMPMENTTTVLGWTTKCMDTEKCTGMSKEMKSTRVNGLTIKELEMVLSAGILANSKNLSRLKDGSKLKSNSDKL
jgi:hypothetical protein